MESKKTPKGFWASVAILASIVVGAGFLGGSNTESVTNTQEPFIREESGVEVLTAEQIQKAELQLAEKRVEAEKAEAERKVIETQAPSTTKVHQSESSSDYYTNVDGNQVHRPVFTPSAPSGASAQCRDGSYSFSQNRRGTCSGHGGVASWL